MVLNNSVKNQQDNRSENRCEKSFKKSETENPFAAAMKKSLFAAAILITVAAAVLAIAGKSICRSIGTAGIADSDIANSGFANTVHMTVLCAWGTMMIFSAGMPLTVILLEKMKKRGTEFIAGFFVLWMIKTALAFAAGFVSVANLDADRKFFGICVLIMALISVPVNIAFAAKSRIPIADLSARNQE